MTDPGSGPNNAIERRYCNYLEVGHNELEFLVEFGQWYEEDLKPRIHSRIVTSPFYAKEMAKLLQNSIDEYERTFGPIKKSGSA